MRSFIIVCLFIYLFFMLGTCRSTRNERAWRFQRTSGNIHALRLATWQNTFWIFLRFNLVIILFLPSLKRLRQGLVTQAKEKWLCPILSLKLGWMMCLLVLIFLLSVKGTKGPIGPIGDLGTKGVEVISLVMWRRCVCTVSLCWETNLRPKSVFYVVLITDYFV